MRVNVLCANPARGVLCSQIELMGEHYNGMFAQ
jgi:hypothetical protein